MSANAALRKFAVSSALAGLLATGPAQAGGPSPWQIFGMAQPIVGEIARAAERSAAEERQREAYQREQERRAELRRTKAGRAQLAREEREAKRQAQMQTAVGMAVLGAILGGGGGEDSHEKKWRVCNPGMSNPADVMGYC
jgi:hypothetical protein